jgi:hypothetical protein
MSAFVALADCWSKQQEEGVTWQTVVVIGAVVCVVAGLGFMVWRNRRE